MSGKSYLPGKDADLLSWAQSFSAHITATPLVYSLTAAIATSYAATLATYSTTLAAATNPATRGKSTIVAKQSAKVALVAQTRQVVRTVQGTPNLTAQQRSDLGISLRDAHRSPNPPPAFAPAMVVEYVTGRTVRVRLRDAQEPTSRAKPFGVFSATVMSAVSPTAPVSIDAYRVEGQSTRNVFDIIFPDDVADGAKVWLIANWNSTRGICGPSCAPVSTHIAGGVLNLVESVKTTPVKKAA